MELYLNDRVFLKELDNENYKEQLIRLTVLKFSTEEPIASLEGKATGGSINLNGNSSIRRALSGSVVVDPLGIKVQGYNQNQTYSNIINIDNLISLNKKIKVEIGFTNTLAYLGERYYPNEEVIWIPLGLYIMKTANVSKNNSGAISISLNGTDKSALLNGEAGGVIPADTVLSEQESFSTNETKRETEEILLKNIIKSLVINFGGERAENIIITDLPDTIDKVIKWNDTQPVYLYEKTGNKKLVMEKPSDMQNVTEFFYGDNIGYREEPFVYPGTLEAKAGETVATILDKIKNMLGNFEWFYDVYGRFHFQEKKNYINNSVVSKLEDLSEQGYLSTINMGKSVYTFDSSNRKLITNISNAPQYQNIKNDLIILGTKKTKSGAEVPLKYHLAFDSKPSVDTEPKLAFVMTDFLGQKQPIFLEEGINLSVDTTRPIPYIKNLYYLVQDTNGKWVIEYWDSEINGYRLFPEWEVCHLLATDWRSQLYFNGRINSNKIFYNNYYAAELNSEFPKMYDIQAEKIDDGDYGPVYQGAYNGELKNYQYFLDFLEGVESGNTPMSQFNIVNIGRRTKIGGDKSSTCIFPTEVPNYYYILPNEKVTGNKEAIQISEEVYNRFATGGSQVVAYDKMKELLVQCTQYNEVVNITTIPIYYLEPNSRISIEDNDIGLNGDYIINTISLPLTIGTSTIACSKCLEKTI